MTAVAALAAVAADTSEVRPISDFATFDNFTTDDDGDRVCDTHWQDDMVAIFPNFLMKMISSSGVPKADAAIEASGYGMDDLIVMAARVPLNSYPKDEAGNRSLAPADMEAGLTELWGAFFGDLNPDGVNIQDLQFIRLI